MNEQMMKQRWAKPSMNSIRLAVIEAMLFTGLTFYVFFSTDLSYFIKLLATIGVGVVVLDGRKFVNYLRNRKLPIKERNMSLTQKLDDVLFVNHIEKEAHPYLSVEIVRTAGELGGVDLYSSSNSTDEILENIRLWHKKENLENISNCVAGHSSYCRHKIPAMYRWLKE